METPACDFFKAIMVKVTLGSLSGSRASGYEFYVTGTKDGVAEGVRRVPAETRKTTGVGAEAEARTQQALAEAAQIYASFDELQRDFYDRSILPIEIYHRDGTRTKKALTGKEMAIHDILQGIYVPSNVYKKPLGFCLHLRGCREEPIEGATLKITTEKLGQFTYEEQSRFDGTFPPSALAPKYEPYTVSINGEEQGTWKASYIHARRKFYISNWIPIWTIGWHGGMCLDHKVFWSPTIHFQDYGISAAKAYVKFVTTGVVVFCGAAYIAWGWHVWPCKTIWRRYGDQIDEEFECEMQNDQRIFVEWWQAEIPKKTAVNFTCKAYLCIKNL